MTVFTRFLPAAKNDDAEDIKRRKTSETRTGSAGPLPNPKHAIENNTDNVQLVRCLDVSDVLRGRANVFVVFLIYFFS